MPPPIANPDVTPPPPSLRRILWWLFFDPAQVPALQVESPWRGLRVLLVALFLAGLAVGAGRAPGLWHSSLEWTHWFGQETGAVWLADGKLRWERPETLPYATTHAGWRVEFMPAGSRFSDRSGEGPERSGIWISPETVRLWVKADGADVVQEELLFTNGKLLGRLDPLAFGIPLDRPLRGEQLEAIVRRMLPAAIIGALLLGILLVAGLQVGMYLTMFAAIPVLLRSPWAHRGFFRVFAFYCFLSVPPLLAATVYSALELPGLDFGSVYVFGFLLYVFMMFWLVQRANVPKKDTDDDEF